MSFNRRSSRPIALLVAPLIAVLIALVALAPLSWAHDDATLDTMAGPHGGQLRAAGIYHYELVVAPAARKAQAAAPLAVYVTDHAGTKVPTAGATGTATILSGAQKTSIALKPDSGNAMKGEGVYPSGPDMKVIVSITMQGKAAEAARFTPLAKPTKK